VAVLNFLVNFLLLLGSEHLCGYPMALGRAACSAILGGIYAGLCMISGFAWLGNTVLWLISLALISLLAFGYRASAMRRGFVFVILSLALNGLVSGLGGGGLWNILISAVCLFVICRISLFGSLGSRKLISVELEECRLFALCDTGNTLKDPVTGKPVLVVAAEVAEQLTGLTRKQLQNPAETIGTVPGMRLIPYKTIGTGGGLLLAKRFEKVKIGPWQGSALVAFAPEGLSTDGEYQALIGGVV
jgi:stage II sporulation protein GA (sporulation sigma-E factor processing peptidase)